MAEQITVDPELLKSVSNKFRSEGEHVTRVIQELKSRLQSLYSNWEGVAEQKFMNDYQQAEQSLSKVPTLLENVATELNAIAERFRQADTA